MVEATFLKRLNRFVAHVRLDGREIACHVKNTGRCRELLVPGAAVWLQKAPNPRRSTGYDLVTVRKGERLVNIDSQAPNVAFGEWLQRGSFLPGMRAVRREVAFGSSRFDFCIETETVSHFVEVKGVTLEVEGIVLFPDAPTLRGVRHLKELALAVERGFGAHVVFVVQMKGVRHFVPNWAMHEDFGLALQAAAAAGVGVTALDCLVTPDTLLVDAPVPVHLGREDLPPA
jgi:sugar fermentation stimulation protein A